MRKYRLTSSAKESAVEAELVRRVKDAGGICDKVTVIGRRGFFDRLVILPGARVIFVEIKRPRGSRIAPHQKRYHANYAALGVAVAVIKNMRDIDTLLPPRKK